MNQGESQADDQAAKGAVTCLFGGDAENDEYEYAGENDFDDQACKRIAVDACQAVGAKAVFDVARCVNGACHVLDAADAEDEGEQTGACNSACALRDNIADKFAHGHAAGEQHAERNSRIDVTAGDVAYAVSHADDNQTERQRGEKITAAACGVAADQHGGTAAKYDQNKGSDKFGYIFFHGI